MIDASTDKALRRFISKIEWHDGPMETPCWRWTGPKNGKGYGRISISGRQWFAHRWMYEQVNGPVQRHLETDHLCRVRACVNPQHLEVVTRKENQRRGNAFGGVNYRKTHCIRGHEFTPENTRMIRGSSRRCMMCHMTMLRAYNDMARQRKAVT